MRLGLGFSIIKKNEKQPSDLIELDIEAGSLVICIKMTLISQQNIKVRLAF